MFKSIIKKVYMNSKYYSPCNNIHVHISCIPYSQKKLEKKNNSNVLKYLANVPIEIIYVQQYFDFHISVTIA